MTRHRLTTLLIIGVALPPGLNGQSRAMPAHVTACSLSDSLLGNRPPDGHIVGEYNPSSNMTSLGTEPERIMQPGFGLRGIEGIARFEGREPSTAVVVQLDLRLIEPSDAR
ncbi:MAG: hypothetical protein ABI679_15635 [Gemmatimonadota bacterium]